MDLIQNLLLGFKVALSAQNVLYCFFGAVLGTIVGVLPGMNPVIVISVLLPLTFKMPAAAALIMLAGIYYGCHHSGATCAIMLNMPGEPSSLVICLDGHPMARKGRAGPALFVAAIASFFAGSVCIILIALLSPLVAQAALNFQAPEYTSVVLLAMVGASAFASRSVLDTLGLGGLGLLLGTIGTDPNTGVVRFTFGEPLLANGVDFVSIAVGLFAVAEIASRLAGVGSTERIARTRLRDLLPNLNEFRASLLPIFRGTAIGAALGVLPGTGPLIASFTSYSLERRLAKDPAQFGNGAIQGVAGPEAADNAAAFMHFVPMLTLGIPAGATFALLLGALMIQGIAPGPLVMVQHPDLFWGLIASMWIGNMMLLVLNLPLVGVWIRLLQAPYRFIYPIILVFSCIGVYSIRNEAFDVIVTVLSGGAGYLLRRLDCSPAPLVLGLLLGPIMEENLRRSLLLSRGDPSIFVTRPVSACILLFTLTLLVAIGIGQFRGYKDARILIDAEATTK